MREYLVKKRLSAEIDSERSRIPVCSLFAICSLVSMLILIPLSPQAKVSGNCSNCHTMHNSQNGAPVIFLAPGETDTDPKESLLRGTCLGCHSKSDGNTWKDSFTQAPIVFNSLEPTYNTIHGLAGGNFYYVSTGTDNTGHNIFQSNSDGTLGNIPPGGAAMTAQLRCAGTWGCHGHNGRQTGDIQKDDQIAAMKGAHHGEDAAPLTGSLSDVAKSYRFLLGIKGREDSDWEKDNTNTSHNEYRGTTSNSTDTISYLCAECHGKYHTWTGGSGEVGINSPWFRHPTDIALKNAGEYANYTTYDMTVPVGRQDPDNVADTTKVTPGEDVVICLSCHRSHASKYFKLMRWDYKRWPESGNNGCTICHTSKN